MNGLDETWVERPGYRIAALLEDIEAVVTALGAEKLPLVGHDWGASIGWSYVTHPDHGQWVKSWSLISGPHLAIWRLGGVPAWKHRSTNASLVRVVRYVNPLFSVESTNGAHG